MKKEMFNAQPHSQDVNCERVRVSTYKPLLPSPIVLIININHNITIKIKKEPVYC